MKKETKVILLITAILFIIICIFSILHQECRIKKDEGALQILYNGKINTVSTDQLKMKTVEGIIKNGKGEKLEINISGAGLKKVLEKYTYEKVAAVADDEYSVQILAEETEKAYLIVKDDGSLQLVIFGDENSKRAVKKLIRLELY